MSCPVDRGYIMTTFLLNALPGIVAAIIASCLTAKLALRGFYSEKWWERKEKAYSEIIEALYDLLQYCEIKKEDYGGGTGHPEDKLKELADRHSQALWKIKKTTNVGAFIVSAEAQIILMELRDRPRLEWEKIPPLGSL